MKDWHICEVDGMKYLFHMCNEIYAPSNKYPGVCFEDPDFLHEWLCRRCFKPVPEEMCFVAELAGCKNVNHLSLSQRFNLEAKVVDGF